MKILQIKSYYEFKNNPTVHQRIKSSLGQFVTFLRPPVLYGNIILQNILK